MFKASWFVSHMFPRVSRCFHPSELPNFRAPRQSRWKWLGARAPQRQMLPHHHLRPPDIQFHIYVWGWVKRSIGHLISGGWEPGWTDQPYIFWICLDYSSIKSDISFALTCSHCSLTDSVTYVWANILGWR
jgi:hypothetical protein